MCQSNKLSRCRLDSTHLKYGSVLGFVKTAMKLWVPYNQAMAN